MGIGIVLIFWIVVGSVLAAIAGVVLLTLVRWICRGTESDKLVLAASVFPFVCLGWAGAIFVAQALVNEQFFHRDVGLGDSFYVPLQNGYQLLMIDVTDDGWVYRPKTQPVADAVGPQSDAVDGVRQLQVAGPYIFAMQRSDSYVIIDTRQGMIEQLASVEALRARAQTLGFNLKLEPISQVYRHYRFGWFDLLVAGVLVLPPAIGLFLLFRWARSLRVGSRSASVA